MPSPKTTALMALIEFAERRAAELDERAQIIRTEPVRSAAGGIAKRVPHVAGIPRRAAH